MQNTGIARIKVILSRSSNAHVIGRYYASAQERSNYHNINKIPLNQGVYVCNKCGLDMYRDLNSGIYNDWKGYMGSISLGSIGALTPVDDETAPIWNT
ncbi:MAG: hypothetical protein JRM72_04080 [Nitrososphaerota archaeon]|jgi:transposase|nr:hypothetical protein [Nitrososphaerota archaeon]